MVLFSGDCYPVELEEAWCVGIRQVWTMNFAARLITWRITNDCIMYIPFLLFSLLHVSGSFWKGSICAWYICLYEGLGMRLILLYRLSKTIYVLYNVCTRLVNPDPWPATWLESTITPTDNYLLRQAETCNFLQDPASEETRLTHTNKSHARPLIFLLISYLIPYSVPVNNVSREQLSPRFC